MPEVRNSKGSLIGCNQCLGLPVGQYMGLKPKSFTSLPILEEIAPQKGNMTNLISPSSLFDLFIVFDRGLFIACYIPQLLYPLDKKDPAQVAQFFLQEILI